jgi:two-component system, cell cycle sensor histidine kinase and response regulator CckA
MLESLQAVRRSPRTPPPSSVAARSPASDADGKAVRPARPRVVLLADDDPVVRQVVRLLIELQGDTVLEAEDGAHAVASAAAHDGPIDLLLTDVMMPGLTGPQACDVIRQQRPDLPTLFISGYFPEAVFPDARLPPRAAFLSKPFMPDELAEVVDRLLTDVDAAAQPRERPPSERALSARIHTVRRVGSSSDQR